MKYFLSLIVSFFILCTSLSAIEYGMLHTAGTGGHPSYIRLEEGDILDVLNITTSDNNYNQIAIYTLDVPDIEAQYSTIASYKLGGVSTAAAQEQLKTIVGPAFVKVYKNTNAGHTTGSHFLLSYKITRSSEVEYKNVNIISLPSSTVGAGTHEIVVEASDDLQTWTPVHSSSIGGNKAFFRTRVVEIGD
jgi:hypothetical protein